MNNPLDSAIDRARLISNGAPVYVGKKWDDRAGRYPWQVGMAPRQEWQGFFYRVDRRGVFRHGYGGCELMR